MMLSRGSVDTEQLTTLRKILNDYCELAGVPGKHPAREQLGRRLLTLFGEGIDSPDDVKRELDDILKGFQADMRAL